MTDPFVVSRYAPVLDLTYLIRFPGDGGNLLAMCRASTLRHSLLYEHLAVSQARREASCILLRPIVHTHAQS